MVLKIIINISALVFLFGQMVFAQKGTLTVNPELGFQIPLAKNTINGYTKGSLKNNDIWVVPSYGIGLAYHANNKTSFLLRFLNGQAGYSMGVVHKKPCENGYNGVYGDRWTASSFNERRLILAVEKQISELDKAKNFSIYFSIQSGIGIDFRSKESDSSKSYLPSTNLCGEEYYLDANNFNKAKIGLVLPLQINIVSAYRGKDRLRLSVFYHLGLTNHYETNVDYISPNYTERASFKIKGSSFGVVASYPIVILRPNKNQ